jgi:excinuclease UvrABC nuclease subunit
VTQVKLHSSTEVGNKKNKNMTTEIKIEMAITELNRSMNLAAERNEFEAAGDMKRIIQLLKEPTSEIIFTEKDISQLQSKVHAITGNGEVMMLFNEMMGVNAG